MPPRRINEMVRGEALPGPWPGVREVARRRLLQDLRGDLHRADFAVLVAQEPRELFQPVLGLGGERDLRTLAPVRNTRPTGPLAVAGLEPLAKGLRELGDAESAGGVLGHGADHLRRALSLVGAEAFAPIWHLEKMRLLGQKVNQSLAGILPCRLVEPSNHPVASARSGIPDPARWGLPLQAKRLG